MSITDDDVIDAMFMYGGSFVQCVAKCYQHADPDNQAKIKATWADQWVIYTELAGLLRQQRKGQPR